MDRPGAHPVMLLVGMVRKSRPRGPALTAAWTGQSSSSAPAGSCRSATEP